MLCEHIEDYICRLLPSDTATEFEQHLEHCSSCREAVAREQAMFDVLARSVRALEPVPPTLVIRRSGSRPVRKSRGRGAVVLSLTALIALVFAVLLPRPPFVETEGAQTTVRAARPVPPPRIELPEGVAGVTIASGDPDIQIILINAPEPADVNFLAPPATQNLVAIQ